MGGYDWIDTGIEKGKTLSPEHFRKPYTYYGYVKDPFDSQLPIEIPETMVPSKSWLETPSGLLVRIGSSIKEFKNEYTNLKDDLGRGYHLLVYGPTGYGKTTLAKVIAKQQQMRNKENPDLKEKVMLIDIADWLSDDNPDTLKPQLNYRKWMENFLDAIQEHQWHPEDLVLLIVDNLALLSGKNLDVPHLEVFLEDFYRETKKCPLIVGFMKTSEWLYLKQLTDVDLLHFLEFFQPSKVQLNPFSHNEIENLLLKRLLATRPGSSESNPAPFSQAALKLISRYSLGVPQLALRLASKSLKKWALEDRKQKMEKKDIEGLIRQELLTLATELIRGKDPLPRKQMDVLWEVFLNTTESKLMNQAVTGVTNKIIASKFGVRMSAISYHFKQLTDRTLLKSRSDPTDARSQLHYIQDPIFTSLEIFYGHLDSFQQLWTSIDIEEGSD
ncbi:MAG: AAA family ATPase [Candidatus Hodarchaeota archaeon]